MLFATAAVAGLFIAGASSANADQTTSSSNGQQVTVQSGDTLWSLAQKHNVSLSSLEQANNKTSDFMIYVGEQLQLPTNASDTSAQQQTTQAQPVQQETQAQSQPQQQTTQTADTSSTASTDTNSAKEWIANKESSGSYNASNGQYYGRYQLDKSYLNGDYSEANQERVANQYVTSRYGSWANAQSFWQQNGWY
ncbi:LysM peptidoglycan-binding domain-containing protein [Apilactobacillus apisilvae]|uniref:LysM peptidoglycan-binding domain-containing protein n=1 Tax=Apilactobacillus apisilvae TaxID=2923364 RepID=A0ABY4PGQ2_9LACO|nr:LysM domain-containing protein [Apilactobacillus apisilvae]UQS84537.1 LysM peptidoglycan-binding domain-containing protein [Apilactobacillus apisilvae]